jgi:DNA-binding response OmpR family regulator
VAAYRRRACVMVMSDVLLVDSSPSIIDMITPVLEESGYDVTSVKDGVSALQILGGLRYAAVVTELDHPEMSGLDLIRSIRMRDNTIPIVVLSSVESLDRVVEAMREGADDFLRKGTEDLGRALLSTVERTMERKKREKRLQVYEGVLPICAYCKNVRYLCDNEKYAWVSIEQYFNQKKSVIDFSHGICPTCLKKHGAEGDR